MATLGQGSGDWGVDVGMFRRQTTGCLEILWQEQMGAPWHVPPVLRRWLRDLPVTCRQVSPKETPGREPWDRQHPATLRRGEHASEQNGEGP